MSLEVGALARAEIFAATDEFARLRITVFAEWPYQFAGEADERPKPMLC